MDVSPLPTVLSTTPGLPRYAVAAETALPVTGLLPLPALGTTGEPPTAVQVAQA